MKLKFETSNLSPAEISGLIALLETLLPDNTGNAASDNDTPLSQPALGLSAATVHQAQQALESLASTVEPPPGQPTTSTRKRRTKAEIATDEAAAQAKASPAPAEAKQVVCEATPDPVAASEPEPSPTPSIKPIDADTLRSLLNSHIQKHSMEEAIAILQAFGCNRVTEALALEPTKLAELAGKLDG